MSSDWRGPDEDDEDDDSDYTSSLEGADLTDQDPRFFKVPELKISADELSAMKIDELIKAYINIRNQLATYRKGYKKREADMKLQISVISMTLRFKGDQLGVDSFASPLGTAYRNKKTSFRVGDWDALSKYVLSTGNIHILQKRVSPNAVKEIQETESTADKPFFVPGVDAIPTEEFAVRSPTKRK